MALQELASRLASERDRLRESEARLRGIFEAASVGIVRVSRDGRIAECNAAYAEMLGEERPALVGRDLFAHLPPEEAPGARVLFEKALRGGKTGRPEERRYVRRDGLAVWGRETLSFLRSADGEIDFVVMVIEDVTAQRQLETSLRHAQKLEAVGRLAAGLAHELNTPSQFLHDIVHFVDDAMIDVFDVLGRHRSFCAAAAASFPDATAELARAEADADLPYLLEEVPKALRLAIGGLERVRAIVHGMTAFAHPGGAEMAPADLNEALESTLAVALGEYRDVADVVTDFGAIPPVKCHVGELNQAFLNILVNAAHAIADVIGDSQPRGRIHVRTWSELDTVVVAIGDTGGGIPEQVQGRVFDPFFSTKEVGRGTGQGLAIARLVVVDKHRGALTFTTEVGLGTTFFIRLPVGG